MSFIGLKFLVLAQIGIDFFIVIFFIFIIKHLKHLNKGDSFDEPAKTFEALLGDADKIADQFNEQLEEKQRLIKTLNEKLDIRITSLKTLILRADTLLSSREEKPSDISIDPTLSGGHKEEILELAKAGRNAEEIAEKLVIPKEEVKLILDLRKKLSNLPGNL